MDECGVCLVFLFFLLEVSRLEVARPFKMASSAKRSNVRSTAEQVLDILMNDMSEGESDIDSEIGGMSSGEEFELDNEVEGESDQDPLDR